MRQQLHQVSAQMVRKPVNLLLVRVDFPVPRRGKLVQLKIGFLQVSPGQPEHHHQRVVAAAQRQRRRLEENRVQSFNQLVILVRLLFLFPNDLPAPFFIGAQHREKADGARQVENRVRVGDHAAVHRLVPQVVQQPRVVGDGHSRQHQHRLAQVEKNIHDADPPGLPFRADGANDGRRHAVAEVDTDNHRINRLERQQPGG